MAAAAAAAAAEGGLFMLKGREWEFVAQTEQVVVGRSVPADAPPGSHLDISGLTNKVRGASGACGLTLALRRPRSRGST